LPRNLPLCYHGSMETRERTKFGPAAIFAICPAAHITALISGVIIVLHFLLRGNRTLMAAVSDKLVQPVHQFLAGLCAKLPGVSVAELVVVCFVLSVLAFVVVSVIKIIARPGKVRRLYSMVMGLVSVGLMVYALFSLLWGVYYYGDDFAAKTGFEQKPISVEQLETVTVYFADMLNGYSEQVERDERGFYAIDRRDILDRSAGLYDSIQQDYPCLRGEGFSAKGLHFSRVLSYMDFTGFFFPFTGEANVNMDFPVSLFPSTVAHELAHQRGVAKEQEANFVAVLASLASLDTDFCYSACLLAYTHLGNALHSADYEAWERVYVGLDQGVLMDFAMNRYYWQQFETPVQEVSTAVYENFLYSYDQELGMKSYGACVDLLVNYYYEQALEHFEIKAAEE